VQNSTFQMDDQVILVNYSVDCIPINPCWYTLENFNSFSRLHMYGHFGNELDIVQMWLRINKDLDF
jgi:hypothetical protein